MYAGALGAGEASPATSVVATPGSPRGLVAEGILVASTSQPRDSRHLQAAATPEAAAAQPGQTAAAGGCLCHGVADLPGWHVMQARATNLSFLPGTS